MKRVAALMLCLTIVMALSGGCAKPAAPATSETSAPAAEKKELKLGVRADMADYANEAVQAMKAKGYTVEVVTFDDSVAPDTALAEGSIDANMYQHEPYLKNFNTTKGTHLVMLQPKLWAPVFGLYSSKHTTLDQLTDGATIGLCNDATNQARGLNLLNEVGLIKLPADVKAPTLLDVQGNDAVNPKHLKFIEADMATLPQSLKDVDGILLAGVHMVNAGLDGSKYLASPKDSESFAVGVAVQSENETKTWAKDLNEAFKTEGMKTLLKTKSKDTMIPLF